MYLNQFFNILFDTFYHYTSGLQQIDTLSKLLIILLIEPLTYFVILTHQICASLNNE